MRRWRSYHIVLPPQVTSNWSIVSCGNAPLSWKTYFVIHYEDWLRISHAYLWFMNLFVCLLVMFIQQYTYSIHYHQTNSLHCWHTKSKNKKLRKILVRCVLQPHEFAEAKRPKCQNLRMTFFNFKWNKAC